ncbi:MAG: hypothetical protein Q7T61_08320 [Caulobacter sp.]|nr:hypothetical protein [Caulobacter sp.]
MAIYRETAHALFGDGATTTPTPKPVREPVKTRTAAPADTTFTRDTTVRTAPAAETSFMATPAFGERETTAKKSAMTRPLIIAGLAGIVAIGAGAMILMSQPGDQGVPTAEVSVPAAATPAPPPTPAPAETVAATPTAPPAPVEAAPVQRAEAPAPARRAAPAARRAAPAPAATPEEVTAPTTGPVPYTSTTPTPAPAAAAPAVPAPPPVITPEPVPAPTPAPAAPELTPVPQ